MTHLEPCACGSNTEKVIHSIQGFRVNCNNLSCIAATAAYPTAAEAVRAWNAPALLAKAEAENARLREALGKARDALIDPVNIKSIVCTVWMPSPCPETLVDFIDAALGDTP